MSPPDFLNIVSPPTWMTHGLCAQVDPELFYPEKGGSTQQAKQVCLACPVRAECLTHALHTGDRFGVWGGTSERQRRRLRHQTALPAETSDPETSRGGEAA